MKGWEDNETLCDVIAEIGDRYADAEYTYSPNGPCYFQTGINPRHLAKRLERARVRQELEWEEIKMGLIAITILTEDSAHAKNLLGTVHRTAKAFLAQQGGGAKS